MEHTNGIFTNAEAIYTHTGGKDTYGQIGAKYYAVVAEDPNTIGVIHQLGDNLTKGQADYIVKCVNSHDGLVEVLEEITVDNCPCSLGRIVSSKAINKAKQALAAAKS